MTQAPEDFTPETPERDRPGEPGPAASGPAPLVPGQRPAPDAQPGSYGPVLPQAGDAAIPQAVPAPPMPEPTAPPSALPVDMAPPGYHQQPAAYAQAGAAYQQPGHPGVPPGPIPVSAMPPWPGGTVPIYMPRPEPRRSRLATVLVVALLVAVSVFGGALANGWRPAFMAAETGALEGPAVLPGEGTIPSPDADAPQSEVLPYLKEQAELVLDAQSESLLNGSLEGWLAAYDPTLHDQMTGRFNSLTSMQVSRFDYQIASGPLEDASGAVPIYDVSVAVSYCFVEPADTCKAADLVYNTRWRAGEDGMVMIEVADSTDGGPHPWEVTDLVAAVGERTVTAVPLAMEARLDEALEVSEAAAQNADEWAYWEKPDRYVVYIAPDEEFDAWFDSGWDSEDVLGYALPLTGTVDGERQPSTYATVMGVDRTGWGAGLTSVIRHELGHAVTLWAAPSERYDDSTWWMVEGVAEYIDHGDRALDEYDRMWDVRDYVEQEGGCESDILPPDGDDDTLAGSGKYGCGFLGVHYVIEEYGVDKFTEFFGATVREGGSTPEVAEDVFGKSYADLMEEVTAFIAETV